ncbi:PEP-CTERM sorting domain-containing protein [Lacipirellula parvula]|uniref:Ice-binding protein C-terminal domain-containing protein n=1 Tax=Lacipirellula parvula TaxID=2650471 RepID=A0A5K7XL19_9BACT|nr:PEP-CTERM sorting domain-containing protein [Lacipirellula parvula]BBO35123.1 hypothetical protein PLANPX_4735 [Lacipirellula parvula]
MAARFGLGLLLATALVSPAAAQTVKLFDNFDSYTTQAEFEAAWPVVAADPLASTFLQTQADTGFAPVSGPNMIGMPLVVARNGKTVAGLGVPSTTNIISYSFDFYDSDSASSPYRQYNNLQVGAAPTSTNQLVALGLNNNQTGGDSGGNYYMARILGFAPSDATLNPTGIDPDGGPNEKGGLAAGQFFKLNDFGVGLRSVGWHNLRVDISSDNGIGTDYAFYVDNVLAERVSDVGTVLRELDTVRLGSGVTSTRVAYIDNFNISVSGGVTPPVNNADFNNDNIVDGKDFLIWQRGFGVAGSATTGDANNDTAVNDADLAIWKTQFGTDPTPVVGAVSAVPEPTTIALAGVALVGTLAAARRRK